MGIRIDPGMSVVTSSIQTWVLLSFKKRGKKLGFFLIEELNILLPWRYHHRDIVLCLHQHPEVNFNSLKKAVLILPLMAKVFATLMKFSKLDSSIVTIVTIEHIDLIISKSFSSISKGSLSLILWAKLMGKKYRLFFALNWYLQVAPSSLGNWPVTADKSFNLSRWQCQPQTCF